MSQNKSTAKGSTKGKAEGSKDDIEFKEERTPDLAELLTAALNHPDMPVALFNNIHDGINSLTWESTAEANVHHIRWALDVEARRVGDRAGKRIKHRGEESSGLEHGYALALAKNIFENLTECPTVGAVRARMVALFDMVVHEESNEGDILFNIFDELRTLAKLASNDAETWLDIAHEQAFTRTSRFRAALYGTGAASPTEETRSREES